MLTRKFPRWQRLASGLLGWLAALLVISTPSELGLPAGAVALGAEARPVSRSRAVQKPAVKSQAVICTWQVLETANFRILSYGSRPVDAEVGQDCERLREALCAKWQADRGAGWAPKCDVVLHPNDASYLREVGAGATSTVASSLVDHKAGSICLRRVRRPFAAIALANGRFTARINARNSGRLFRRQVGSTVDRRRGRAAGRPGRKAIAPQSRNGRRLADRSAFRVVELLTLEDYPASHRWGAFYGQSLSLVEYLTKQRSTDDFIRFVQLSFDRGYDASLREVYGLAGVAELERCWKTKADLPPAVANHRRAQTGVALAEISLGSSAAN